MSQDEHVELDPGDEASSNEAAPSAPPSMVGVKVELDIEDAPFLDEPEEEEAPEPEPAPKAPPPEKAAEKGPGRADAIRAALLAKKKLIIIGGAGLGVLLLVILLLVFFLGGEEAPPPPPPEPEPIHIVAPVPKLEEAPEGPKFLYSLEPFFIERRGEEGEIRFLRCRFSVPTDNPMLYAEMMTKTIALRDSVYYYLINKPLVFLTDGQSSTALKEDIVSVINEHLATEKIGEIFIEEYFISGR